MTIYDENPNTRAARWLDEEPVIEWELTAKSGRRIARCASHDEALALLDELYAAKGVHSDDLTIRPVTPLPDYLGETALPCAESRFCRWAFSQLGQVTVFACDSCCDSGSLYLVIAEDGRRAEGETLAQALLFLIEETIFHIRKPTVSSPKRP